MSAEARVRQTAWDMVRSVALVFALVLAVLLLSPARRLIFPPGSAQVAPVSYVGDLAGARHFAPVLAPAGLPGGWRATSSSLAVSPLWLHIGFVTPRGAYLGLEQSTMPVAKFVARELGKPGATVIGTVPAGGRVWQLRYSASGSPALTSEYGSVTVVLTGTAGRAELAAFAAALQPS